MSTTFYGILEWHEAFSYPTVGGSTPSLNLKVHMSIKLWSYKWEVNSPRDAQSSCGCRLKIKVWVDTSLASMKW